MYILAHFIDIRTSWQVPTFNMAMWFGRLHKYCIVTPVINKNKGDDSRPIRFEWHGSLANCYSILCGKINKIYDVLETVYGEQLA